MRQQANNLRAETNLTEQKMDFDFLKTFQVILETIMNSTCSSNYNESCLQTPTEPKIRRVKELFLNNFSRTTEITRINTCNYNENYLQHEKIRSHNLVDKTWPNKQKAYNSIFSDFFLQFHWYWKKRGPATTRTPDLRMQRQLLYLQARGKQPARC